MQTKQSTATSMRISIIGAGIAGLTTAIALRKKGIHTTIYEASREIKEVGAGLALSAHAIKAFQKLGIAEAVIAEGRILPDFSILDQQGRVITKVDSMALSKKYGIDNFLIHRANLHKVLAAQLPAGTIQLNKRAIGMENRLENPMVAFEDGSSIETDVLIIADGINSVLRKQILPQYPTRYAGYTCWRAVVQAADLDIAGASETWSPAGRFGIAPLASGDLYWFACINAKENDARFKKFAVDDLLQHFSRFHAPVLELINRARLVPLLQNDMYDLMPMARFAYGNILFIGDAAHATTPNLGKGACQAIEDAVVLADEWQRQSTIEEVFEAFEQRRIHRTHYIVKRSRKIGHIAQWSNQPMVQLRNFIMRHLPASLSERQIATLYDVDF